MPCNLYGCNDLYCASDGRIIRSGDTVYYNHNTSNQFTVILQSKYKLYDFYNHNTSNRSIVILQSKYKLYTIRTQVINYNQIHQCN
jgi:hypothetical protein